MIVLIAFGAQCTIVSAGELPDSLQIESAGPCILDTLWSDLGAVAGDALLLYSAPLRFDGTDWAIATGVLGGTGLIMTADEGIRDEFGKLKGKTLDDIAEGANALGTNAPAVILVSGLYAGGLVFDVPHLRKIGLHASQALIYSSLITAALKGIAGRHRPMLENGAFRYELWAWEDQFNSLPSGHTTLVFALASSFSADIDNPWVTAGLYTAASATALERIYSDRHWASDVFLAAAIGTACGYGVVHLHDDAQDADGGLSFIPAPNGIHLSWRF